MCYKDYKYILNIYIIYIAMLLELVKLIKLVFGSLLVSSASMHLVGIAGCCLPLCSWLHMHRIVSIYSLLVDSWILHAASCYVMTLAMYLLQFKVVFIGNNHHTFEAGTSSQK
jgi:hypothetical protein